MDYRQPLDLYCERVDASFWSEPLNALSNAAFIVAAIALTARARKTRQGATWDINVLAVLVALIGLGSFAFHTFATVWASLLDVLFIEIFIYVYLARYLHRVGGLRWPSILAGLVLFAVFERALTAQFEPGALNGSYRYLPAVIALVGMSVSAQRLKPASAAPLYAASALLCIALLLRTIDHAACESLPLGTHFLWHLFNAGVLYLAAVALMRELPSQSGARPI